MNELPRTLQPAPASVAAAPEPAPAPHLRTGAGAHGWQRWLLGAVLGWPATDPVTLLVLRRVFFPLSRLWAAAHVADGQAEAFCAAVPMQQRLEDRPHLTRVLARFEEARAAVTALEAERWHGCCLVLPICSTTTDREGAVTYTYYDYLELAPGASPTRIEAAYVALLERFGYVSNRLLAPTCTFTPSVTLNATSVSNCHFAS